MLQDLQEMAGTAWADATAWHAGLGLAGQGWVAAALGAAAVAALGLRPLARRAARAQADAAEARRALAAAEARAERLAAAEAEAAVLRNRLGDAAEARADLTAELEGERAAHAARLDELRRAEAAAERKFAALAQEALGRNAESFLNLVSERFESHRQTATAELDARRVAIEGLVKPVAESLGKFEAVVGELEKARAGAYAEIREQVAALAAGQKGLSAETGKLVQALRAPQTRGRWGEFQLRQVFEMAGMLEHVDFALESGFDTDEGRRRPDALVRLPGGKCVVVDAKTPLDAYLTALEATDPDAQRAALAHHARQLRGHVRMLGGKDYWRTLPETPDFVVMFVPGEAFYAAAMAEDPGIFETALEAKVLVCSPTTLIALIKSVAYGWRQEKLAESAEAVARDARLLHDRLARFGDLMDGVGRGLKGAVEKYNQAVGSLETRVLPAARRFETAGVLEKGADLPAPAPVETAPRGLGAPEFSGGYAGE